jgi:hypothetical protein
MSLFFADIFEATLLVKNETVFFADDGVEFDDFSAGILLLRLIRLGGDLLRKTVTAENKDLTN